MVESWFASSISLCSNMRTSSARRVGKANNIMLTQSEQNLVLEKTRELCSTILAQPNMGTIRKNIDSFMADDKSRSQYETLMQKGQELHDKQHRSLPLSGDEVGEFEKQREAVLNNPVARGFLDAQQALHQLQETVTQQITKTLELGRLPKEEDFEQGSCGHGCGCGHGHEH
jgi:cell fate (sporulation/competence/biofilm development) regulator YlbF (YheA/YmcA/DUF963 family)